MDEIEDFVEEDSPSSSDLFDCEYTSIDAVINQIVMFTGCIERQTENGTRLLVAYGEGINRSAFYTDSKKLRDGQTKGLDRGNSICPKSCPPVGYTLNLNINPRFYICNGI